MITFHGLIEILTFIEGLTDSVILVDYLSFFANGPISVFFLMYDDDTLFFGFVGIIASVFYFVNINILDLLRRIVSLQNLTARFQKPWSIFHSSLRTMWHTIIMNHLFHIICSVRTKEVLLFMVALFCVVVNVFEKNWRSSAEAFVFREWFKHFDRFFHFHEAGGYFIACKSSMMWFFAIESNFRCC